MSSELALASAFKQPVRLNGYTPIQIIMPGATLVLHETQLIDYGPYIIYCR